MKDKLKKITDLTVNDLLQSDIILPSQYFQTFDRHSKTFKMDINDEEFDAKVNQVIVKEFEKINGYMTQTITSMEKLTNATNDAKQAIINRDEDELSKIYNEIESLQEELSSLQNEIYIDSLTKVFNKKWIYSQFVNKDGNIKNNGVMILVNVNDYDYILQTHGHLIADNLIRFLSDYIYKNIKEEGAGFKMARYSSSNFLIFFDDVHINEARNLLNNIQKNILGTTLKSKSGIIIQTSFYYTPTQYKEGENFQSVLETLVTKVKEMN